MVAYSASVSSVAAFTIFLLLMATGDPVETNSQSTMQEDGNVPGKETNPVLRLKVLQLMTLKWDVCYRVY